MSAQIRYDEELRAYLKTNGLHPSDLIKARTKKREPRHDNKHVNANTHSTAAQQHHQQAAATRTAAAASATLSPNNQQQQLTAYQDGSTGQRGGSSGNGNNAAAAGASALPNFSQAWAANQSVQQLLAQMGFSGQIYTNADGTLSVDNANLASLLALQPQLFSQASLYT